MTNSGPTEEQIKKILVEEQLKKLLEDIIKGLKDGYLETCDSELEKKYFKTDDPLDFNSYIGSGDPEKLGLYESAYSHYKKTFLTDLELPYKEVT